MKKKQVAIYARVSKDEKKERKKMEHGGEGDHLRIVVKDFIKALKNTKK